MRQARSSRAAGSPQSHPHIRLAPTPVILTAARMTSNDLDGENLTTDQIRRSIKLIKRAAGTLSEETFMEILDEIDRINAAKSGI